MKQAVLNDKRINENMVINEGLANENFNKQIIQAQRF